jgi:hypothetical protein
MRKILTSSLLLGALGVFARPAAADDDEVYNFAWSEPGLRTGIGVTVFLGGGIGGFTDSTMRDVTSNIQGLWDARVTIGSHIPIGLTISYVGTAQSLNSFDIGTSGHLIGTAVEGALQVNILPHYIVNPYIFGGLGWQRYDVTGATVTLADTGMNSSDNLLTVPMGGGFQIRQNRFVFDTRGVFRAATNNNLVLERPFVVGVSTSNSFASMHTWEVSSALGFEF